MKYNKALDGFRGLAVLLVFLLHMNVAPFGWIGVEMFFVLSGFLITSILLTTKGLSPGHYLKRFYWRRTMRIWPLYFTFVLLLLAASEFYPALHALRRDLGYLLTFTYNFLLGVTQEWQSTYSHLWSLSIEEQFYFIWPLVIYVLSTTSIRRMGLVVIVLGPLIRYVTGLVYMQYIYPGHLPLRGDDVYPYLPRGMFVYVFSLSHFDAFATGALLAVLPASPDSRASEFTAVLKKHSAAIAVVIFGLAVTWGVIFAANWGASNYGVYGNFYHIYMRYNYQYVWGYTLLNVVSVSLILALTQHNWLRRLFSNRPLVYLGKVSFGFYVLHLPMKQVLREYLPFISYGTAVFHVCWFAASLLAAAVSYHLFESFFLRQKNYFERRQARQREIGSADSGYRPESLKCDNGTGHGNRNGQETELRG